MWGSNNCCANKMSVIQTLKLLRILSHITVYVIIPCYIYIYIYYPFKPKTWFPGLDLIVSAEGEEGTGQCVAWKRISMTLSVFISLPRRNIPTPMQLLAFFKNAHLFSVWLAPTAWFALFPTSRRKPHSLNCFGISFFVVVMQQLTTNTGCVSVQLKVLLLIVFLCIVR